MEVYEVKRKTFIVKKKKRKKIGMNEQFGRKMNKDIQGNRNLF